MCHFCIEFFNSIYICMYYLTSYIYFIPSISVGTSGNKVAEYSDISSVEMAGSTIIALR